jgi:phage anti-repressor protein
MIGKGFTSRFEELYKLTVEELGEEYARMFLYIYKLQENELHVPKEECVLGLNFAKEIIKLYDHQF